MTEAFARIDIVRYHDYVIKVKSQSIYPATKSNMSKLYLCHRCFDYFSQRSTYTNHISKCTLETPGHVIYHKHNERIHRIDGHFYKDYVQRLCLFGKLFIDTKTVFFDVEYFDFFLLTEAGIPVAFFSREKRNVDNFNLACIITFPPFQSKQYGRLLIECSYALSHLDGYIGTPERPLSQLGQRSYLSFWRDTLVRSLPLNPTNTMWSLSEWSKNTGLRQQDIVFTLKHSNLLADRVITMTDENDMNQQILFRVNELLDKPARPFRFDIDCLLV
ncbi:hypothetical protein E3P81_01525 [Wallemia ichthyophaga]|nr:hypothetical protein E3P97_01526 [Wallemia ichthyophaga]TIB33625.1 hypothetical protein E3P85_01178 [Wallemia ichthyophaga]TIB47762.1 hypothetical protein E3P82_01524 [Wallemia ichthyophaga]TIB51980.1 hypothetical protein E3P81_01525 [Wallemia ichthyophaga]TIB54798.1 hypothetical protein E3P80_01525 [Wallemia ichthyophaga]